MTSGQDETLISFLDDSDDENDSDDMEPAVVDIEEPINDLKESGHEEKEVDDDISSGEDSDEFERDFSKRTGNVLRAEDLLAAAAKKSNFPSHHVDDSQISFDLGNICSYDGSSLDDQKLSSGNPDYLYKVSRRNMQALLNRLWGCSTTVNAEGNGLIARLPPPRTKFPREKPVPSEPDTQTRWQAFAKKKGIRSNKRKRKELVWDEASQSWKKPWGFRRANDPMDVPIYEHKEGDDPSVDPWMKLQRDKKKRITINKQNQIRNLQQAVGDRVPGSIDLQSAANRATDFNVGKRKARQQQKSQKFNHLNIALKVAQQSTASMGRYDKLNRHEPQPKYKRNSKQETLAATADFGKERNKQHEIMYRMFGSEQKNGFNVEKAAKKAQVDIERRRGQKRRFGGQQNGSRKKRR